MITASNAAPTDVEHTRSRGPRVLLARFGPLVILLIAAVVTVLGYLLPSKPGDRSPEAGFARDMSVHHAQAVSMAMVMLDRSRDSQIRVMATDIALTQQAQIGQMHGWLDAWGLLATGPDPPMAWMRHTTGDPMPGMVSPAELSRLRQAPIKESERDFLRLMIRHHEGGIVMAQAVLARSRRPEVARLASAIVDAQRVEIAAMKEMLVSPP